MSEDTESATPQPAAAPAAAATLGERLRAKPVGALALAAVLLFAWQWYDSHRQISRLQQELGRKLAEADVQSKQSVATTAQVGETVRETQAKLAILEEKQQASQDEQVALEALYKELARSRDESVLADIEQMLVVANQQLQIGGNVQGALLTLQAADAQLARGDRPQFSGLRKAFAHDIERLKLAPAVDVPGISARLNALLEAMDELPLAMELRPPAPSAQAAPAADSNIVKRFARELWMELRDLVRIQRTDRDSLELLPPEQRFFLRENIKLRLLSARIALLARDGKSFQADLKSVRDWLTRYYDVEDRRTADTLSAIQQLRGSDVGIELPDIGASLDAVRSYRISHGR